jgi:hypothetical protein
MRGVLQGSCLIVDQMHCVFTPCSLWHSASTAGPKPQGHQRRPCLSCHQVACCHTLAWLMVTLHCSGDLPRCQLPGTWWPGEVRLLQTGEAGREAGRKGPLPLLWGWGAQNLSVSQHARGGASAQCDSACATIDLTNGEVTISSTAVVGPPGSSECLIPCVQLPCHRHVVKGKSKAVLQVHQRDTTLHVLPSCMPAPSSGRVPAPCVQDTGHVGLVRLWPCRPVGRTAVIPLP